MRTLFVLLVAAAALSGCTNVETPSAGTAPPTPSTTTADPTAGSTSPSGTTPTGTTPRASTSPPATRPAPSLSGLPPPNANEVTLEGVVQAGVEAGCLLLNSQGGQYLLLGGDQSVLREGQRVIVRGQAQPGVATTCQQGVPFIVADARLA
jgi:hypothetical protein